MNDRPIRIFPLGDTALTVEFGNVISPELNQKAISLAERIESLSFPGFIETVPAYASTTIFYDVVQIRRAFPELPTAFEAVKKIVLEQSDDLSGSSSANSRLIDIPVKFDRDREFDLEFVANEHEMSLEEVVAIFTSTTYRVYMLGFLPGFSYMGEVDERIATPRKETPRTLVPKGSLGIAGRQTGIYSLASPGGWQIIGRTDAEMFTPDGDRPCPLQPGDMVRFYDAAEHSS